MSPLLTALLPLIIKGVPEAFALIKSVLALRKAMPELTAEQINAIVTATVVENEAGFDELLTRIAADQPKLPAPSPQP